MNFLLHSLLSPAVMATIFKQLFNTSSKIVLLNNIFDAIIAIQTSPGGVVRNPRLWEVQCTKTNQCKCFRFSTFIHFHGCEMHQTSLGFGFSITVAYLNLIPIITIRRLSGLSDCLFTWLCYSIKMSATQ